MQVSAANRFNASAQLTASAGAAKVQAATADLTQLAVAQSNAKATASAGAALAQATGELTGTLVNISA